MMLQPFNITLEQIRNFSISQKNPIQLPATGTIEFKRLNKYVSDMTDKIRRDYKSLKEFSENASHEMQTPISIAKAKIELLLSNESLPEKDIELLTQVDISLQKLSSLVGSLGLLTKIENSEFSEVQQINLSKQLEENISYFSELITLKGLELQVEIESDVHISMDPNLLDILLSNLLKNAVRHNIGNGYIRVTLQKKVLTIENSGPALELPAYQMFERFKKGNQSNESLGLGLSLVKKIADLSNLAVEYRSANTTHSFTVKFQ
jgi:signal transduction histidine kinase